MAAPVYAQHFTPLHAVDLAYDLIWDLYGPFRRARIIDPACGEGAFLFRAIERGLTSPDRAFGIERDPSLARRAFGRPGGPRAAVTDALAGLAAPGIPGSFDLVVANPPYGTGAAGLRELGPDEAARLVAAYDLWAIPAQSRQKTAPERLRSYPAEILFLELCISLARPGGHVAILLPEGIAANARYRSVREWLLANVQLDAVIGLPRDTFRRTGAAAKTALLLMTNQRPDRDHAVLLGEVEEWSEERPGGQGALSFRACRPQSNPKLARRLDPSYWHPGCDELLGACRTPLAPLGDFTRDLTYGPIVTGEKPPSADDGVPIVNQGQVRFCGVDLTDSPRVPPESPWLSQRSMLQTGDVVLPRSGEGSLGKHRVAVFLGDVPAGVGSFVDLIRLRGLNPFYLAAFLKSRLGRAQVSRVANGVGVPNISFEEIRSLLIPQIPSARQRAIERRYRRRVLPLHHRAVARHGELRRSDTPARTDSRLARLREVGEGRWRSIISDLDTLLLDASAD